MDRSNSIKKNLASLPACKRTIFILATLFSFVEVLAAPSEEVDWHDYLIQDTCRDSLDGDPIEGDPHDIDNCPYFSNLKPGERVLSGFKYADELRLYGIWSLPRSSPNGEVGFVHFDSAAEENGGKGLFDLDDPHCKIAGTLCQHSLDKDANTKNDTDTDIVDIVEATWNGPWNNVVSVVATAHRGTKGYLGFNTNNLLNTAGASPDGWLLGLTGGAEGVSRPAGIMVYPDGENAPRLYSSAEGWNKANCALPLGQTPSVCNHIGYNQWLKVDSLYMGESKTFKNAMISMHTFSYQQLTSSCDKHLELFIHSKEYGLMSHQVWRAKALSCNSLDPMKYPITNIGCQPTNGTMIHNPMDLTIDGQEITMERFNCVSAVKTVSPEETYEFDPRSFSQPSRPNVYPNARVVDQAGYGNLLLDGNFSWENLPHLGAWTLNNAIHNIRMQNTNQPAPLNKALELHCYVLCENSSIYQDVNIAIRSPGTINKNVDFGVRVASLVDDSEATGTVYLFQLDENRVLLEDADGAPILDSKSFTIGASETKWPNPKGLFIESSTKIDPRTSIIRFQIFIDKQYHAYMIDDAFVTRRD